MKITAADIARRLNISRSTVSLALNDKPGVSQTTKEAIYRCIEEIQNGSAVLAKKIIKVIHVHNELNQYAEFDFMLNGDQDLDQAVKKMGYTLGVTYVKMDLKEIEQAIQDANQSNVVGVILGATDIPPECIDIFNKIKKPLVVSDNDAGPDYHCSVIGNMVAIRDVVDYLVLRGCKNIKYLGNAVDIYNFRERRAGFRAGFRKNNLELKEDSIVTVGRKIKDIYEYMISYLQTHELPDAFIMDNYQVSIGTMRALKELNISVPKDVSLVGVDEIPELFMPDYQLTTVKIHHKERAHALMTFLEQEINGTLSSKFKIYSNCKIIDGDSVK